MIHAQALRCLVGEKYSWFPAQLMASLAAAKDRMKHLRQGTELVEKQCIVLQKPLLCFLSLLCWLFQINKQEYRYGVLLELGISLIDRGTLPSLQRPLSATSRLFS